MRKFVCCIFVLTALAVLLTSPAFAASEPFVVKDEQWYRQDGDKLSDAPTPSGGIETEAGWIHWLFADPEISDEAKGVETGLYFYAVKTGKYSFIPFGGNGMNVNAVHFSPDGAMFVVEGAGEEAMYDVALELFSFADGKSLFKTAKAAMGPTWIDAARFVYDRFEPGTSRGTIDEFQGEGVSVSMYDAIAGEETVLKKATETSDFSAGIIDNYSGETTVLKDDGSGIWVTETWVNSTADWDDPDKAERKELTVPLPAAG